MDETAHFLISKKLSKEQQLKRFSVDREKLGVAVAEVMVGQTDAIDPVTVAILVAQEMNLSFATRENWKGLRHMVMNRLDLLKADGKVEAVMSRKGTKQWRSAPWWRIATLGR